MKRSVATVVATLLLAPYALAYRPRPVSDIARTVRLVPWRIASNGKQLAAVGYDYVQLYSAGGIAADAPVALPIWLSSPDIIWSGERWVIVSSPFYGSAQLQILTVTTDGEVEEQPPIPVPFSVGWSRLYSDGKDVLLRLTPASSAIRSYLLDARGRLIETEPSIDERAFGVCESVSHACSANGSRVLSIRSEYVDGKVWRVVTSVRNGNTLEHTSATEVSGYLTTLALEPDGAGWRAIGSGQASAGVARFDAEGNLLSYDNRVACCTNHIDPAAAWIGPNAFLSWMDSLFELTAGGAVRANARRMPDQSALSLISTGDSHFATWVEDGHLRAARLDRSGAFLDGVGIDFGPPALGPSYTYDELSTLRFLGWNGHTVAVPNGSFFILAPIADLRAAKKLPLDFESSTAAWNGTEWGVAGAGWDGSLVFARISAEGRVIETRMVAAPRPGPGIMAQQHREPALMWDGVQYILVWVRHDFHPFTGVNPPVYFPDDRTLLRLRLDRDGVPIDGNPYALDYAVDEAPVVATNGRDDVVAWSRAGSVEMASFRAAASDRKPQRVSSVEGQMVAVAASGTSFVATWLHEGMDGVARRHIALLHGLRLWDIALIAPHERESVAWESAIDARLAGVIQRSGESDNAWRAGVIGFGDSQAPVLPPPPLTVTASGGPYDLHLRWNADDAALFFTIERRNESGVFGEIAVVPSGRTEWIGGRPYADYRVRAWNSVGKSLPSNVVR